MAGYMTKLQGYLYEGELVNGHTDGVENGVLMVVGTGADAGKLMLPAADAETKLLCKEVTDIYDGVVAYRFVVNKLNGNYYFVENGFEFDPNMVYDLTTYKTAAGKLLRAHPIQVGEEFVTNQVTGTPVAGTEYGVQANGTIG